MKKVLFYSHDTMGLGHIRRTQKIANHLAGDGVAILIICSSPKFADFPSEPGIEYIKLPGFTKLRTGAYRPRNLDIGLNSFVKLRKNLILSAVQSFRPDVFVVDKEPLGVKGELRPSLEFIRDFLPNCHKICGLRDILDEPELIHKEWQRRGSAQALVEFFDSVLVYGQKDIYDSVVEYQFDPQIAQKTHFMGYILDPNALHQARATQLKTELPLVTLSLGGGEDGEEYLSVFVSMLEQYESKIGFESLIVTGPFLSANRFQFLKNRMKHRSSVRILDFIPDINKYFQVSDVLVTMGGYNTFTEFLSLRKRAIVLPRVVPRKEQLIRAQIFSKLGQCDYLHPDELSAKTLFDKIDSQLKGSRSVERLKLEDGLSNTSHFIKNRLYPPTALESPQTSGTLML